MPHNPVLAAKHTHLIRRDHDRLVPAQARAACAATLLRWLYAIVTRREPFDADIAAGRSRTHSAVTATAA